MISLLDYQQPAAALLLTILREGRNAIDTSATGTGKTFVACWVASQLGRPVAVICPKAVVGNWERTLALAGVTPVFVTNYEKIRYGSTPYGRWEGRNWAWTKNVPPDTLLIWDEAHKCAGEKSQNARMLAASKASHLNLMVSATLAEDPTELKAVGYLLGLHSWGNFWKWCMKHGCWRKPFGGMEFKKKTAAQFLLALHRELFPRHGVRLRIEDLGDAFPENQVTAEAYDLGDEAEMRKVVAEMQDEIATLNATCDPASMAANAIVAQLKARQRAELLKVPGLVEMTNDLLAEGKSVVVFTNFQQTLDALQEKLPGSVSIHGQQTAEERQSCIDKFQADQARVIIVNIAAGGVGVSLHDTHGNHPRVSLICPTFNAKDLKQALGRIHRSGGKSKCLQRLVFSAGTVEEKVCRAVQSKLDRIDLLNDGDLAWQEQASRPSKKKVSKVGCGNPEPGVSPVRVEATPERMPFSTDKNSLSNCGVDKSGSSRPAHTRKIAGSNPAPATSSKFTAEDMRQLVQLLTGSGDKADPSSPAPGVPSEPSSGGASGGHGDRAHARLSPSSLKAKAICPGFRNDPDGDKSAADRGTLGHECVEKETPERIVDDEPLKLAVEKLIGYKHQIIFSAGPDAQVFEEVRLEYFDQWGFSDLVIVNPKTRHAHLLDWKFAWNFYKADSPQFWAYMLGIWRKWPFVDTITVHVCHPFLDKIDIEHFSREKDYDRLTASVKAVMVMADRNDPLDYQPSAQCAYCGHAAECGKLAQLGVEVARRYDETLLPKIPKGTLHGSEITDPQTMAELLRIKPALEKALSGWPKAAMEMYHSGTEIPGYELAQRVGKRQIENAAAVFELVKDKITLEQFLKEACQIRYSELEELYASTAPPRQKGKYKELLDAILCDADLIGGRGTTPYLKPKRS